MDVTISVAQSTFLFDDRKRFDAQCEHDRLRSSLLSEVDPPTTADPWKQRPVDFTMKNFHPNRKKEKRSTSMNLSAREKSTTTEISTEIDAKVMKPFVNSYDGFSKDDDENEDFELDTRISYERVKRMLNTEQYRNPQLHDYRQYPNIKELGLSEFLTTYSRDPSNIRFLSDRLNTIWLQERENERRTTVEQVIPEMYRPLSSKPKWESRLILPKLVFPNKYAAYTRFRNPTRTVRSAYWERVEENLEQQQTKTEAKKRLAAV